MVFTPVGEVQSTSVVPWAMAEKAAKDFFKEEWVEEPGITMFLEGLEEGVVLTDRVVVEEAAEATLEEVAEKINLTPAGEGKDLTMQEKTSRTNVAITQLDMVR